MPSKYGRKLNKLDSTWKKTKDEHGDSTGGFETVPSGNYVIGKLHAELEEDQNGCLRVARSQTILEGDHAGFVVKDRMNIDPSIAPRGQEFLLKWLNLLGYQVDSLSEDLEETIEAINANQDATFSSTIKEKDGWNNVYYNKVLEEGGASAETEDNNGEVETGEMPDLDAMTRRQLNKLVQSEKLNVEVADAMADDDLRDAIETAWRKPRVGATKEETSKSVGRVSRRGSAQKSGGEDDEKTRKSLFNLGDAFGIPVEANNSLAELIKTLKEYTFKKKELEAKEAKLLEDVGLSEIIK